MMGHSAMSTWPDSRSDNKWLGTSNLEGVYPISSFHAAGGHDNHWFYSPPLRLELAIAALQARHEVTTPDAVAS